MATPKPSPRPHAVPVTWPSTAMATAKLTTAANCSARKPGRAGEIQGSIRNSGVARSENGNVLLLQEVHLKVENQPDAGSDKLQTNLWPINRTPVLSIAANAEVGQMIGSRISSLNLQQWVA